MYINKKWLTVQEVAHLLSLSPEMVYKLARKNEMPAIQLGSSWRISRDELENWLQSKKTGLHKIDLPELQAEVLNDFQEKLKAHYGKQFVALYIYGSVARGTEDAESDLDTLVVLKKFQNRWKELKEIQKLAYQVSFGQGRSVVLSTTVASAAEFKNRQDPLFERIRHEGKKAA